MLIEKGMLIAPDRDPCWYVVVKTVYDSKRNETVLYCICDHANNIHDFKADEIRYYLTLEEMNKNYDVEREILSDREIPWQVVAEVLSGYHDHRFDHWLEWHQEDMMK